MNASTRTSLGLCENRTDTPFFNVTLAGIIVVDRRASPNQTAFTINSHPFLEKLSRTQDVYLNCTTFMNFIIPSPVNVPTKYICTRRREGAGEKEEGQVIQ